MDEAVAATEAAAAPDSYMPTKKTSSSASPPSSRSAGSPQPSRSQALSQDLPGAATSQSVPPAPQHPPSQPQAKAPVAVPPAPSGGAAGAAAGEAGLPQPARQGSLTGHLVLGREPDWSRVASVHEYLSPQLDLYTIIFCYEGGGQSAATFRGGAAGMQHGQAWLEEHRHLLPASCQQQKSQLRSTPAGAGTASSAPAPAPAPARARIFPAPTAGWAAHVFAAGSGPQQRQQQGQQQQQAWPGPQARPQAAQRKHQPQQAPAPRATHPNSVAQLQFQQLQAQAQRRPPPPPQPVARTGQRALPGASQPVGALRHVPQQLPPGPPTQGPSLHGQPPAAPQGPRPGSSAPAAAVAESPLAHQPSTRHLAQLGGEEQAAKCPKLAAPPLPQQAQQVQQGQGQGLAEQMSGLLHQPLQLPAGAGQPGGVAPRPDEGLPASPTTAKLEQEAVEAMMEIASTFKDPLALLPGSGGGSMPGAAGAAAQRGPGPGPAAAAAASGAFPPRSQRHYWLEHPEGSGQWALVLAKSNFPARIILPLKNPGDMARSLFGGDYVEGVEAMDDAKTSKSQEAVLVDGLREEVVTFALFHHTNGRPRYLQRVTELFKRHSLALGDVLHFRKMGPGRAGVTVLKAGSQGAEIIKAILGFDDELEAAKVVQRRGKRAAPPPLPQQPRRQEGQDGGVQGPPAKMPRLGSQVALFAQEQRQRQQHHHHNSGAPGPLLGALPAAKGGAGGAVAASPSSVPAAAPSAQPGLGPQPKVEAVAEGRLGVTAVAPHPRADSQMPASANSPTHSTAAAAAGRGAIGAAAEVGDPGGVARGESEAATAARAALLAPNAPPQLDQAAARAPGMAAASTAPSGASPTGVVRTSGKAAGAPAGQGAATLSGVPADGGVDGVMLQLSQPGALAALLQQQTQHAPQGQGCPPFGAAAGVAVPEMASQSQQQQLRLVALMQAQQQALLQQQARMAPAWQQGQRGSPAVIRVPVLLAQHGGPLHGTLPAVRLGGAAPAARPPLQLPGPPAGALSAAATAQAHMQAAGSTSPFGVSLPAGMRLPGLRPILIKSTPVTAAAPTQQAPGARAAAASTAQPPPPLLNFEGQGQGQAQQPPEQREQATAPAEAQVGQLPPSVAAVDATRAGSPASEPASRPAPSAAGETPSPGTIAPIKATSQPLSHSTGTTRASPPPSQQAQVAGTSPVRPSSPPLAAPQVPAERPAVGPPSAGPTRLPLLQASQLPAAQTAAEAFQAADAGGAVTLALPQQGQTAIRPPTAQGTAAAAQLSMSGGGASTPPPAAPAASPPGLSGLQVDLRIRSLLGQLRPAAEHFTQRAVLGLEQLPLAERLVLLNTLELLLRVLAPSGQQVVAPPSPGQQGGRRGPAASRG